MTMRIAAGPLQGLAIGKQLLRKICQIRRRHRMRATYRLRAGWFRPFPPRRLFSGCGDSCTMSPRCHEKSGDVVAFRDGFPIPRLDRFSESLMKCRSARGAGVGRLSVLAALLWSVVTLPGFTAEEGQPVGKVVSSAGALLERTGKSWRVLPPKSEAAGGRYLVSLPGSRGEIVTKDGALQLSLWGNLPAFYDYPLWESVVVLQNQAGVELDFILVRGRVVVTKLKGQPPARVRVGVFENTYELVLTDEGSEVALELFGRWSSDVRFSRKQDEVPTQVLMIYALKGSADLKIGNEQFLMPAPASFRWDNIVGREPKPTKGARLPAWASAKTAGPEAAALQAAVKKQEERLANTSVQTVLMEELKSADPAARELAVYSAAAIDELPILVDALSNPKFEDERRAAIHALRHWIGEATMAGPKPVAGQDLKLFRYLVQQAKYTEREAESVLQLLHGFRDADRDRPETYELLIEYLHHSKLPIRELARWYLYRWVSAGRNIPYDPADQASVSRAYKEWKKLVPDGQLPPRPKEK